MYLKRVYCKDFIKKSSLGPNCVVRLGAIGKLWRVLIIQEVVLYLLFQVPSTLVQLH